MRKILAAVAAAAALGGCAVVPAYPVHGSVVVSSRPAPVYYGGYYGYRPYYYGRPGWYGHGYRRW